MLQLIYLSWCKILLQIGEWICKQDMIVILEFGQLRKHNGARAVREIGWLQRDQTP